MHIMTSQSSEFYVRLCELLVKKSRKFTLILRTHFSWQLFTEVEVISGAKRLGKYPLLSRTLR